LFERFTVMYGAKFLDQWRGIDPVMLKKAWGEELASLSVDEIKRGLETCRTKPFPPTLPEFISFCEVKHDAESAYYEALSQMRLRQSGKDVWSHPAIYWTAARIGTDLNNQPWAALKSRWVATFKSVMDAGTWPEVPPPRVALPEPGQTSITREEADKRMQEIRKKAGLGPREEIGGKGWAHKLIACADAGEDVGFTALRFAKEAIAPNS
jgi:hypothetical protein